MYELDGKDKSIHPVPGRNNSGKEDNHTCREGFKKDERTALRNQAKLRGGSGWGSQECNGEFSYRPQESRPLGSG